MTLYLRACRRNSHRSFRAGGYEVGLKMVSNDLWSVTNLNLFYCLDRSMIRSEFSPNGALGRVTSLFLESLNEGIVATFSGSNLMPLSDKMCTKNLTCCVFQTHFSSFKVTLFT